MFGPGRFWRRMHHLLQRSAREAELNDEVRFHLEMLSNEYEAEGLTPEEARARAEREFGNMTRVREEVRDAHGMTFLDDWLRDARFGLRALRRTPGFTGFALATLALGIGGTVAVFSLVYGALLAPLPYRDPGQLMALYQTNSTGASFGHSLGNFRDWRDQNTSFVAMSAVMEGRAPVFGGDDAVLANVAYVTGEYFEVLGLAPHLGRTILPDDYAGSNPPTVVLSHGLWQRIFGGRPDVIGQSINLGQGVAYTVVGVMPPHRPLPATAELWASRDPETRASRIVIGDYVVGRLRPDVTVARAEADLQQIAQNLKVLYPRDDENQAFGALLVPLAEDLREGVRRPLLLLQLAAGAVLLIACVNLAATGLARGAVRQREMALRGALGASRGRLLRQLLVEHLVLGGAGGILGIGVAVVGVRVLRATLPDAYLIGEPGSAVVIPAALLALGVTLLAAVAIGLAPASAAARVDLRSAIGNGAGTTPLGRGRLAWTLVAVETGFAVVLVVATGLFLRTLDQMLAIDPGFDSRNVLTASVALPMPQYNRPVESKRYWDQVLVDVRALPGVDHASITNFVPLGPAGAGFIDVEGGSTGDLVGAGYRLVADDYFETMGVRLVAGRTFGPHDRDGVADVTVINEAMARRYWPAEDPLGKRFKARSYDSKPDVWLTVIGVVADIRYWGLTNAAPPEHYVYHEQRPDRLARMTLVVSTQATTASLIPSIRTLLRTAEPGVVPEFSSITERIAASVREPRLFFRLLGGFAAFALLLAAIGVYGVLAYVTGTRRREFGVRLALGAVAGQIQRQVIMQALRPVLIGALAGMVTAVALSRLIAGLLYGVAPTSPVVHLVTLTILIGVGVAASWWPARRAARLDPAVVLQAE